MTKSTWKYALIPAIAMTILALYPQVSLWISQGSAWNGSYHVTNYDEVAYSAYVNALINGAPRKNDPFLGRSDSPETPQPETLYSVQFIPAYSIAIPARLLGLSASTAFILLIVIIAIFSSLAVYWLFYDAVSDTQLSAVGTLAVLCLGTAAAFAGELRFLLTGNILADFLPFLRRYQPGFAFPIFFVFCVLAKRAFNSEFGKQAAKHAVATGITFTILVYSYFYLWTAAAAFLACFGAASFVLNRAAWKRIATVCLIVGVIGVAALVPYFYLLNQRSTNLDNVQLLALTRVPQFAAPSLIIGLIIAAIAVFAIRKGRSTWKDVRLPLIFGLSLMPLILFNQQVITGHSLQPVHYELFIANYMVVAAAILTLSLFLGVSEGETEAMPNPRWLVYLGFAVFFWGFYETAAPTARNAITAEIRDESVLAVRYAAKSASKGTAILATNFVTADAIPTFTNVRPLWNPHTSSAGGVDVEENKRLFYLHVYFSGFNEESLRQALRGHSFEVTAALFGANRALPDLGEGAPVTSAEIDAACAKYATFARSFDARQAYDPVLSSFIVPTELDTPGNIDRWYDRDEGKDFGFFRVYKLKPKFAVN
ncbi:MAG TPA: hypothetical protein VGQ55_09050 [Pyrinomonadaceae bacterium]|jgi:hypothetical protein|nr:hypothetical protein [Pyrinomonadaceae bacterium]